MIKENQDIEEKKRKAEIEKELNKGKLPAWLTEDFMVGRTATGEPLFTPYCCMCKRGFSTIEQL